MDSKYVLAGNKEKVEDTPVISGYLVDLTLGEPLEKVIEDVEQRSEATTEKV
jgi:hypothetical protein